MQRNFLNEASKYIKSNRRHRVRQKIVRVMAGCVVFCTTYALILPAITKEQETFCGYEEHTHSEECYVHTSRAMELTCSPDELALHVHSESCLDADGNIVCGLADYVAHTHNADCVDANGVVVCAFPEAGQHVHDSSCYSVPEDSAQSHTHAETCYAAEKQLVCTNEETDGHVHSDGCYTTETVTTCTLEESVGHTHTAECYITENALTCTIPESVGHTHASECFDAEGSLVCTTPESAEHTHGDDCYTAQQNLICGQNEQEAHTHGDDCYTAQQNLTCGQTEQEAHTHSDSCYETPIICGLEEVPASEPELVCTAPIAEVHVHSAECFEAVEEPLTCQLAESEEHTHSAMCYGTWELICPKEEHTHELACFSDPEADLETAEVWERTFEDVELTGVWADDVLTIAETQLGYTESTRNYYVAEDNSIHGYTRYGDWYGLPYGDWCAMFVSYCIHYAEIDGVPLDCGCQKWIEALSEEEVDLYREAGEYDPKPGDIIFFDWEDEDGDSDDVADHVGLVAELIPATETEPAKIKTIEGNSGNRVTYNTYDADDTQIFGYGIMPENPNPDAEAALYTYSDDTVYVEVQLPQDTSVPADAVLKVTPIESTDDGYSDYLAQAEEAVEGVVTNIALYDISFYTADGTYYPVDDTAKVTMGFVESPVDAAGNVQVLHFAEEDAVPQILGDVTLEEKEIEMILDDAEQADTAAAAELEQQSMFSLLSRAVTNAPAETEPEVETLTETRTVLEFETPGFSTFAVVEVQTGSYTATALTDAEITAITSGTASLDGRTFVIGPDYNTNSKTYALTNETVTIHENYPDNAAYDHEFERLKAGEVKVDGNTITTPADDGFLWKFIKVDGNNTYYIQSVETGQYLYIGPGRTVKTTATPNAIVVGYKGNMQVSNLIKANVSLWAASGQYLNFYDDIGSISESIKVFDAKENDNSWNDVFLAEYTGVETDENTATAQWPLDGRQFVISSLNGNTARVMTNEQSNDVRGKDRYLLKAVEKQATVDANGNLSYVALDGIVGASVWTFTKVEGQSNTYYIKAANGYLNLSAREAVNTPESSLTLSAEPQPIKVTNSENNTVTLSASVVNASNETETRFVNYYDLSQDDGGPGFGCYNGGTKLSLTEYIDQGSVLGTGGQFVISWLNSDKTKAQVMTNGETKDGRPETQTERKLLVAVEKDATVDASGNLSYVALDGIVGTSVWTFMLVGEQSDTYYIQSADGKYLNLSVKEGENTPESSLTLSAEPQPIKVTNRENNTVTLSASVVNASNETEIRYVNYYGLNQDEGGPGFGCYNGGTNLSLTEYIDQASVLGTNGGQFVISIPISGTNTASVLTSEKGVDNFQGNNNYEVLAAAVRTVDANGNVNIDRIDTSAVWNFQLVEGNKYNIQSVATGKYLHLDGNTHSLTTEADPQAIEVEFIGNRIALKIPGTDNYVHWQQCRDKVNRGFAVWEDLKPVETNLVLTKYTPTQEDPTQNQGDPVTNLAGKVGILCAVDTPADWAYSAIVTDNPTDEGTFTDGRAGLQTVQTNPDMVDPDKAEFDTVELTNYSHMIWKIIGTNDAGKYYIQSQSTGKYLHLDAAGATLSDTPQSLEVIRAYTKWWPNAICVRASVDGTNYYLNLHGNTYTNPVSAWSFYGTDTPNDTSNNFLFAELSDAEMASIKAVTDAIDALPTQEGLVLSVRDLLKKDGTDIPDQAHALQTNTIAAASDAIEAYDALTDEQKLFVGVDRINKLEELREWLLGESAEGDEDSGDDSDDSDDSGDSGDSGDSSEGGESTETAKETGRLPNEVPAATASGVTVKLFNYTKDVKSEQFYADGFHFFNDNGNSVDGGGSHTGYVDKIYSKNNQVTYRLNEAGYPVLVDNSVVTDGKSKEVDLSNLFDVNGKYTNYTMTDGGGLFRQDGNGYYFYYSDMNAAYYDVNKGKFILYDTIVRPGNASWNNDDLGWNPSGTYDSDRRANFLPFNELINSDDTSGIIYDSEYHQNENVQDIAVTHGLALPDEKTPVPTATINDRTDLWFGMEIEFDFLMPEGGKLNGQDMVFDFHGDDDVWVFIDGVLVLDLGGTHAAWDGTIDFATGKVRNQYEDDGDGNGKAQYKETTLKELFLAAADKDENGNVIYGDGGSVTVNGKTIAFNGDTLADYTSHNLKFFYLERGGFISYSGIKFNMPTLPKNSLVVNKVASSPDDQDKDFQFRVVEADSNGKPIYNNGSVNVFLKQGTKFTIIEDGKEDQPGTVGEGGIFTLKPGQSALFDNINQYTDEEKTLVVQEILGSGHAYNVSYLVSSEGVIKSVEKDEGVVNTESSYYSSSSFGSADDNEVVTFYNEPEGSGTLSITKEMADGIEAEEDEIFYVRVRMGQEAADTLLPVGTKYHITSETYHESETRTVEEAGIIPLKAGETATIIGITPGLHYEVAEFLTSGQNYKPTYKVEDTVKDEEDTSTVVLGSSKVTGTIQKNEEVAITITNDEYDHSVQLPITKDVTPAGVPDNFYFLVDQVDDWDGENAVAVYRPGVLVQVDEDGSSDDDAMIFIGIDDNQTGTLYFKVYEEETTTNYYYDPTFYIVEVKFDNAGNPYISEVKENGTKTISIGNGLPFVNRKFTEVTVMKTVVGGDTSGTFNFNVIVTVDGIPYIPEGFTATTEGKPEKGFSISLMHDQTKTFQVPYGAEVTVTETNGAGYRTSYEVYSRYEAEDGEVGNSAQAYDASNTSGGRAVKNIEPDNSVDSVKLFPNMLSEGTYSMRFRYNSGIDRSFRMIVDNGSKVDVACAGRGKWDEDWYYQYASIKLKEGANTISIRGSDNDHAPNLDYVDIVWQGEKPGTSVTQSVVADHITIHFTNTVGYELPNTGGTGTSMYTIGGLLLTAAAILLYNHIKRRKEDPASS